jgi:hypothetical protein
MSSSTNTTMPSKNCPSKTSTFHFPKALSSTCHYVNMQKIPDKLILQLTSQQALKKFQEGENLLSKKSRYIRRFPITSHSRQPYNKPLKKLHLPYFKCIRREDSRQPHIPDNITNKQPYIPDSLTAQQAPQKASSSVF